jgi:hypothetical protein
MPTKGHFIPFPAQDLHGTIRLGKSLNSWLMITIIGVEKCYAEKVDFEPIYIVVAPTPLPPLLLSMLGRGFGHHIPSPTLPCKQVHNRVKHLLQKNYELKNGLKITYSEPCNQILLDAAAVYAGLATSGLINKRYMSKQIPYWPGFKHQLML